MVDEARRTSFDRKAAQYDAARPSYPDALVDDLIQRCEPRRMLEVGAGTGKATVLFARKHRELVALEPGEQMAGVLRRNVAEFSHVTIAQMKFEDYAGSGFDLVYAAQSFHWIDPAARYVKAAEVLRPGGALALITNENAPMDAGLRRELDAAYARWFPGEERIDDQVAEARRQWTSEIDASGFFSQVDVEHFPWTKAYTARAYVDLIDTYSGHALLPDERRVPLYTEIADAIDRHGGRVEIPYVAMLFVARLRG